MTVTGVVFDLSQGCVDDGPGLRTVVFLKGCGLGCPWCHNPEGMSAAPEIAFDPGRCIDCGRCAEACPRDLLLPRPSGNDPTRWRAGCQRCGGCTEACPSGARQLVGRRYQVDELVTELLRDRDYYEGTGGGVTFSGGEPLLQSDFVFGCAAALRAEGIHVAVETAGGWPRRLAAPLAATAELVLFDLKHVDADRWRTTLRGDPLRVLDNLTALMQSRIALELRITLVPGFNDGASDLVALAGFLARQPRQVPIRLQALHRLASAKAARFGLSEPPARERTSAGAELAAAARLLSDHALTVACD